MDQAPVYGPVSALIEQALAGRREAWNELVERYLPLVYRVIGGFRFTAAERQDVAQSVWLKLYESLGRIREPEALPGWIAVTTRNEALRAVQARTRCVPFDPQSPHRAVDQSVAGPDVDEQLLRAERNQMIRDGLRELPEKQRRLLVMLAQDPPPSYKEIAERLGIPVGSIGPLRARYLARLRGTAAMRSYYAPRQLTGRI